MLKPLLARFIALCVIAVPAAAQVAPQSPFGAFGEKQPDPAQLAAMIANSQRAMKPASFVLSHRAELALTPEQLHFLEARAKGEDDSSVVRQIRIVAAMQRVMTKRTAEGAPQPTGWVGPVDEKMLRDQACELATIQVEPMLNLMRDRQAVGAVLTGAQIDHLMELEVADVMRAMRPKQP